MDPGGRSVKGDGWVVFVRRHLSLAVAAALIALAVAGVLGRPPPASVDQAAARTLASPLVQILDPGPRWVFRFSYGGFVTGELALTRDELRRAGWTLTIPTEVGDRLVAAGFQATAF